MVFELHKNTLTKKITSFIETYQVALSQPHLYKLHLYEVHFYKV